MKLKLLIIMAMLASQNILAAQDHLAIYGALNVEEINLTEEPFNGVVRTKKSVGGLTCLRVQVVAPTNKARYHCSFDDVNAIIMGDGF
ncbi:MAG: hypothetical protein V4654_01940 [Bdellovibrionota bacterium]